MNTKETPKGTWPDPGDFTEPTPEELKAVVKRDKRAYALRKDKRNGVQIIGDLISGRR